MANSEEHVVMILEGPYDKVERLYAELKEMLLHAGYHVDSHVEPQDHRPMMSFTTAWITR